jgi:ubiquinone/menaquinone biosynthesis C-methylase UbiE
VSEPSAEIRAHYAIGGLTDRVLTALAEAGQDIDRLVPRALRPIDQLHPRGAQATEEMVALSNLTAASRLLDVGCGVGGPARYAVEATGCAVVGIDLTEDYVALANELTRRCGMSEKARFEVADATALPFGDGGFDVVWLQYVAMNVRDRERLYAELFRMLSPGGRLIAAEAAAVPGADPVYPMPWARRAEISFLVSSEETRQLVEAAGFAICELTSEAEHIVASARGGAQQARMAPGGLAPRLTFGDDFPDRSRNMVANMAEGRITAIRLVARRPG